MGPTSFIIALAFALAASRSSAIADDIGYQIGYQYYDDSAIGKAAVAGAAGGDPQLHANEGSAAFSHQHLPAAEEGTRNASSQPGSASVSNQTGAAGAAAEDTPANLTAAAGGANMTAAAEGVNMTTAGGVNLTATTEGSHASSEPVAAAASPFPAAAASPFPPRCSSHLHPSSHATWEMPPSYPSNAVARLKPGYRHYYKVDIVDKNGELGMHGVILYTC